MMDDFIAAITPGQIAQIEQFSLLRGAKSNKPTADRATRKYLLDWIHLSPAGYEQVRAHF